MNAKTLLAIATAVAVLLAGLGAVGAVAADETTEQPTDDGLPGSDAGDADRDRDGDRANDSERERAHEHWNDSELNDSAADERPSANGTDGEFGPHHADDDHGPHHADERPESTGPMWGVSDRVPDHVTQMHETMRSYFDEEEPPYRFGDTFRSITGEELPWSDEDHPRNDSVDDIRNGSDR